MKVQLDISNYGDLSKELVAWTFDKEAAKKYISSFKNEQSTFWRNTVNKPIISAIRKRDDIIVYTTGFVTGEFVARLQYAGILR